MAGITTNRPAELRVAGPFLSIARGGFDTVQTLTPGLDIRHDHFDVRHLYLDRPGSRTSPKAQRSSCSPTPATLWTTTSTRGGARAGTGWSTLNAVGESADT